jgi:hypothetical protein
MLKIPNSVIESLPFDFALEYQRFSEAKANHPFTVDVPAPSSDQLIEDAYRLGGFEVVESSALEVAPLSREHQTSELKTNALQQLESLSSKDLESQVSDLILLMKTIVPLLPD